MKLGQSPEQRALAVALREARREPAPRPNWDAVEERLLEKVRAAGRSRSADSPRSWPLVLVPVAAIAAAFAFFILRSTPSVPSTPHELAENATDGDDLRPNQVLMTTDRPLRVTHGGRAEWTLEPNARATLLERAGVVRIRLDAGRLKAQVVPSKEPERFIVEAAGLRVAVHGTRFAVELRDDRSVVEVEEGVVSVQPRTRADQAVLLRAPSREAFSLAGNLLVSGRTPTQQRSSKNVPRPQHASPRTSSQAPAHAPQEGSPLTIGEVEAGVTLVVDAVNACFHANTEEAPNMKISVRTSITLEVTREGSVSSVSFDPPLSPSVQVCSEEKVQAVRFAPSSDGADVTRVLELYR